jgi:hypothetical protein
MTVAEAFKEDGRKEGRQEERKKFRSLLLKQLARIFHHFLLRKPGSPINTALDSEFDWDSMKHTALRQNSLVCLV